MINLIKAEGGFYGHDYAGIRKRAKSNQMGICKFRRRESDTSQTS
jgi:hypothetical protein